MLYDYVQNNFIIIVNIVFLLIFLRTNTIFEKDITNKFKIAIGLLIVLSVAENVELWAASLTYPTMLRVVMSIIGYSVRPFIVYFLILIVYYERIKYRVLLVIPAVINILIVSTAVFSDIAFSYDEANEFVRGPLGFSAYISSGIYLFLILFYSVRFFKEKSYMEAMIVMAIVIVCAVSTGLEVAWKHVGLLRTVIALSITFYYLYLNTQFFKRDALTGALNRRCFYLDAEKHIDKLSAMVSVDLNNLKYINDEHGHAEGDKAIYTMADCIRRSLLKGCIMYRIGGDEFAILCFKKNACDIQKMIETINEKMESTPYSCAIGFERYNKDEDFDMLCARADAMMYERKRQMKALNERVV